MATPLRSIGGPKNQPNESDTNIEVLFNGRRQTEAKSGNDASGLSLTDVSQQITSGTPTRLSRTVTGEYVSLSDLFCLQSGPHLDLRPTAFPMDPAHVR